MTVQQHPSPQLSHRVPARDCHRLDEMLMQALWGSELRFGTLQVTEVVDDETELNVIARQVHEIEVVFHRDRGALMLQASPGGRIARTHAQLTDLQRMVRARLDEIDDFWRERPILLGVGIFVPRPCADRNVPRGVPPELVIDHADLDGLEHRLEELFTFYTTPVIEPVEDYGPRLVEALTESEDMGRFYDESAVIERYNRLYADFGPPEKSA